MTEKPCTICGHQTPRMACQRCQIRIGKQLSDIVEYAAFAVHELLPGQGGDGRSTERGLGVRLDALDFIAGNDVLPILESWERMWREEWSMAPWGPTTAARGAGQPDQATAYLTGTVRFLRAHLERICEHPAVDDFAHEVSSCWHQARNAARRQPRQAWRVTCPTDTESGECGTLLRVTGEDFGGTVTCRTCRTAWHTERLLWVVASSTEADLWVDTDAAVRHTGVPESTLRRWGREGRIKRKGALYEYKSLSNVLRTVTA